MLLRKYAKSPAYAKATAGEARLRCLGQLRRTKSAFRQKTSRKPDPPTLKLRRTKPAFAAWGSFAGQSRHSGKKRLAAWGTSPDKVGIQAKNVKKT